MEVRASISRHLVLKLYMYHNAIILQLYMVRYGNILQDNDLCMRLQFIIGGPNLNQSKLSREHVATP